MHNLPHIFKNSGYPTPQFIKNNGKLNRFGNKQQYWYVCFDNWILIDDWTGKLPRISQPINLKSYISLTFPEREYLKYKIQFAFKKAEKEKQEQYENVALQAQNIWQNLKDEGKSLYLRNKGLSAINDIKFGSDNFGNFIATALVDNSNKIWSLQKIYDKAISGKRNKSFLKGGKIKGCYSLFGNLDAKTIYISEGLATALSILLSCPESLSVVAYSCHSFDEVAKNIKAKFANAKIYIAADNDKKK